jgi:hypothetical protein
MTRKAHTKPDTDKLFTDAYHSMVFYRVGTIFRIVRGTFRIVRGTEPLAEPDAS